jgi:hypothetical protein
MLQEPHVRVLADQLKDCLEKAEIATGLSETVQSPTACISTADTESR